MTGALHDDVRSHDLVDVATPFGCVEIEMDAADRELRTAEFERREGDSPLMQAFFARQQDVLSAHNPNAQRREQQHRTGRPTAGDDHQAGFSS